jgi:hypothetical protein
VLMAREQNSTLAADSGETIGGTLFVSPDGVLAVQNASLSAGTVIILGAVVASGNGTIAGTVVTIGPTSNFTWLINSELTV